MPTFGERLKSLRREKKLKQADLAEMLGVSERTIRYYEFNEREPDLSGLHSLADFFEVSIDYLTGRSDDLTPPGRDSDKPDMPPEEVAFFEWVQEHVTGMHFYDFQKAMEDESWLKGLRLVYEKEKGRKPGQKQGNGRTGDTI